MNFTIIHGWYCTRSESATTMSVSVLSVRRTQFLRMYSMARSQGVAPGTGNRTSLSWNTRYRVEGAEAMPPLVIHDHSWADFGPRSGQLFVLSHWVWSLKYAQSSGRSYLSSPSDVERFQNSVNCSHG